MDEGILPANINTFGVGAPISSSPPPSIMIRLDQLTKRYKATEVVRQLTLNIPAGSIFGLVGRNGAGKTTTLKILATLVLPTGGSATISGYDVTEFPDEVRELVGYMPDFFGVYDDLTVSEYLDFYGASHEVPKPRRRQLKRELLELVDLTAKRDEYVDTLSRGMKQRLCLARCLMHDPTVLLLDEPASGLDPRARLELLAILRELKTMGKTVIISSHILPELAEVCTELAILKDGQLVSSGTMDEILQTIQQGRIIEITVLGQPELAAALLARQPGFSQVGTSGFLVQGAYRGDDAGLSRALRALMEADITVATFAPRSNPLEDLFLRLTEEE